MHKPDPIFLAAFNRYQCAVCKEWVRYREGYGYWVHKNETEINGL